MLMPAAGESIADAIATAARYLDPAEPLTFVRALSDDDVFRRGPMPDGAMIVVPGIWTSMSAELLAAMRARRACTATGRCPACDATINLAEGAVLHRRDCVVSDDNLSPMVARWNRQVGRFARGSRIRENPA